VKPLEEKGEKPLRVSQAPAWQRNGHAKDVLYEGQYRKAKAKGECPNTKAAVSIDGKGAGSIFYVCQTEKCEVHNRVTRYQPTPQEQAQRKKEALAERVEKLSRVRVLESHPQEAARRSLSARLGDGSPRTTSGAWAMTITAVSPSSTLGKRRRAKPHGALKSWTTRRLRRLPCKP